MLASAATLPEEPAFDRTWALTLLQSTLRRLRAEYEQAGKLREYEPIKPALTSLRGEIDCDAIAADLRSCPPRPAAWSTACASVSASCLARKWPAPWPLQKKSTMKCGRWSPH